MASLRRLLRFVTRPKVGSVRRLIERRPARDDLEQAVGSRPPALSPRRLYWDSLRRMEQNKTTLERAFEIARTGRCVSVEDIRSQLKAEGYASTQLEGRTLSKQLMEIAKKARTGEECSARDR